MDLTQWWESVRQYILDHFIHIISYKDRWVDAPTRQLITYMWLRHRDTYRGYTCGRLVQLSHTYCVYILLRSWTSSDKYSTLGVGWFVTMITPGLPPSISPCGPPLSLVVGAHHDLTATGPTEFWWSSVCKNWAHSPQSWIVRWQHLFYCFFRFLGNQFCGCYFRGPPSLLFMGRLKSGLSVEFCSQIIDRGNSRPRKICSG